MKKLLVIASSILILFFLFTVAFHWYFNPSRIPQTSREESRKKLIDQLENDNAAKYYLQACQALDDSTWTEALFESYDDVLQNGWNREDPDLEEYLKRNEPALELVREGTQKEFCSMPGDDPTHGTSYFHGFREITRLMVIKGRLLVWRKEYADAGRTYSDLLRFCADASDGGIVLHSLVGFAMEGQAYEGVESFLAQLNDEAVCNDLLHEIIDIQSGRVPLRQILESEVAHNQKYYEESRRDLLYYDYHDDSIDGPKVVGYIVSPMRRVCRYLMSRLFRTKYLEETEKFGRYIIELSEKPYPDILRKDLKKEILDNEWSRLKLDVIPDFIFLNARQEAIHRGNILRVALHLHFLKNGVYPEKLDELAALVPEKALIDPFSGSAFIYRKTEDGYLLSSVGGNMKDDDGIQSEPPWNKGNDGDMVFEPPRSALTSSNT